MLQGSPRGLKDKWFGMVCVHRAKTTPDSLCKMVSPILPVHNSLVAHSITEVSLDTSAIWHQPKLCPERTLQIINQQFGGGQQHGHRKKMNSYPALVYVRVDIVRVTKTAILFHEIYFQDTDEANGKSFCEHLHICCVWSYYFLVIENSQTV